jgi:hypothetical protein
MWLWCTCKPPSGAARGQGCYHALNKIRIISEYDDILVTQFSEFQIIPDEGIS